MLEWVHHPTSTIGAPLARGTNPQIIAGLRIEVDTAMGSGATHQS